MSVYFHFILHPPRPTRAPVWRLVGTLLLVLACLPAPGLEAARPDRGRESTPVYFPAIPNHPVLQSVVQPVNSDGRGHFGLPGGYLVDLPAGAVPTYRDGTPATLSISLERGAVPATPVPAGVPLLGEMLFAGPDQFLFAGPLTVRLPIRPTDDMSTVWHIYFDPATGLWYRSFFTGYGVNTPWLVEASVLELGYMTVADLGPSASAAAAQPLAGNAAGALHIPVVNCPPPANGGDCFYYFTVKQMIPADPDAVNGAALVGRVFRTAANPTAESPVPTIQMFPRGRYTFCVSALESPLTLTYLEKYVNTTPVTLNITDEYRCTSMYSCTGALDYYPANGTWAKASDNNPCAWGPTTPSDPATLGQTGDFQVTLTWINTEGHTADLDLHLEGPHDLHIYYSAKSAPDGSLYLDRDWMNEVGNAVENIYQAHDEHGTSIPLASGSYRIYVDHYSGGDGMAYQVRVILNGKANTYSGTLSAGEDVEIVTFSVP